MWNSLLLFIYKNTATVQYFAQQLHNLNSSLETLAHLFNRNYII